MKTKVGRVILGLLAVVVVAVVGLAVYVAVSPQPAVWLLRHSFSGASTAENVPDYDAIKARVTIEKDLVYPSADGRNRYDLYLPKDAEGALPTLVWVHGGAFVAGSKDGIENYAVMLADQGYAVVGVEYEWAPEIRYPGQVRQLEEALAALEEIADEKHLDMERVVLVGDSAGAHIAAQGALLATNPAYEEAIGVESSISSSQLAGAMLYCGPYDVTAMLNTGNRAVDFFASRIGWAMFGDKNWAEGALIQTTTIKDYATADFPPVFITDGNSGSFESQGKALAEDLANKGVMVETLFFDEDAYGAVGHEYQFNIGDDGAGAACYAQTLSFLQTVMAS